MASTDLIREMPMGSKHSNVKLAAPARADQRARYAGRALELSQLLQTTLEVPSLLELFSTEVAKDVPHDGLSYDHTDIRVELGTRARHTCHYRLSIGEHSLGELAMTRSRRFSDAETAALEYMLSSLLYPLRNALMYHQALAAARRDPVTGVNNRATLDDALEREIDLARRHGTPFALVVLDIDRFKTVNDRYGHVIGDCMLKEVAQCAQSCARRSDMVFRYGGEEFVVLLNNTREKGARLLAERIRQTVERLRCNYGEVALGVTVTLGIACLREDDTARSLFDRADQAMLEGKRSGRNQVRAK